MEIQFVCVRLAVVLSWGGQTSLPWLARAKGCSPAGAGVGAGVPGVPAEYSSSLVFLASPIPRSTVLQVLLRSILCLDTISPATIVVSCVRILLVLLLTVLVIRLSCLKHSHWSLLVYSCFYGILCLLSGLQFSIMAAASFQVYNYLVICYSVVII